MMKSFKWFLPVFLCFVLGLQSVNAQSKKQRQLENKRVRLQKEIKKINNLLFENKSKKKSQLSLIEDLNYKIRVRKDLIKVTNEQANLLTREINSNQNKITGLRDELKVLKESYSKLMVKAYKNKNKQSRIMFLLSSDNFKQAYKRLKYIDQYSDFQKKQGEDIKQKTLALQEVNTALSKQRKAKSVLIKENKKAQIVLEEDLGTQKEVMSGIQKNLKSYASTIKQKQKEVNKIDRRINSLIKAAIARSRKKAGRKATGKSKDFALTKESSALARSFLASKGKLPWPVVKGVVKMRYGKQRHPVVKTVFIQSNGVRIATTKAANVRAVYKGEVLGVQKAKRGSLTVLIQHGNYVTSYSNLEKVTVNEGDKVTTKQTIGKVYSNPDNGDTLLRFCVYKNSTTQNPAAWIYGM